MDDERIVVYDGKYDFYMKDHSLHCKRYGEDWRAFVGDGAVLKLFLHAVEQQKELKKLKSQYPPCSPMCYHHQTHPCEKCGRINGYLPREEKFKEVLI